MRGIARFSEVLQHGAGARCKAGGQMGAPSGVLKWDNAYFSRRLSD